MDALPPATVSPHAAQLAGLDLPDREAPLVRVLPARELVVVLSRSRDPRREVFLDRCCEDGVPVVVRPSGGGAVLLGPGTLTASVLARVTPGAALPERHFRRFCAAAAAALAGLGVPVAVRGVSDLALGDRKIAGTSLRVWGERVLFQIALLVDMDVAAIDRYLRHPSREPDYRGGRDHRAFLVTLREAGFSVGEGVLAEALHAALSREAAS